MQGLLRDVAAFHRLTGVPILGMPRIPEQPRIDLRLKLWREEHDELAEAVASCSLPKIAQEMADVVYVTVGAALEFGIPLDRVWAEVQRANLGKADPVTGKVRRREDGKILKPDGWQPPDISRVLGEVM